MGKKSGVILMTAGVLLLLFAVGLFIYNQSEARQGDRASSSVMSKLSSSIDKSQNGNDALKNAMSDKMKTIKIDGYDYIGYLSIPSLDLKLPIMAKWDYTRLKISPCLYYGSYKTDDMVIAGHNYRNHFGRFSNLNVGDSVYFTDADGILHTYVIGAIEVLQPDATEEMIRSDFDLSLYTCTYNAQQRITVRCQRIEK